MTLLQRTISSRRLVINKTSANLHLIGWNPSLRYQTNINLNTVLFNLTLNLTFCHVNYKCTKNNICYSEILSKSMIFVVFFWRGLKPLCTNLRWLSEYFEINPFIHSLYITFAVFSRTWNPYLSLILRVKRKPDWKTRNLTWREMFFQVVICLHIITFMFYLLGLKFLHNIWPFHKLAF